MIKFKGETYELESNVDRRFLHDAITDVEIEIDLEMNDEDEILEWVEEAHTLISDKDYDGLDNLMNPTFDEELEFKNVNGMNLMDALLQNDYDFNTSASTRSMYIYNDNEDEVRVSDHKKDIFNSFGIMANDNEVTSEQLAKHYINLPQGIYFI